MFSDQASLLLKLQQNLSQYFSEFNSLSMVLLTVMILFTVIC